MTRETPDVLLIHGALDTDVIAYPIGGGQSSQSQYWLDTFRDELAGDVGTASAITPVDYGMDVSTRVWLDHLRLIGDLRFEERGHLLPMPHPGNPFHMVEYRQGLAVSTAGDIRYVSTILDPDLGHDMPPWDIGRLIWDFVNPSLTLPFDPTRPAVPIR